MVKKILGLDVGTNSIGWAIVTSSSDKNGKQQLNGISCAGSRIIPMDAAQLGDFAKGNAVSSTKDRTAYRGARRIRERHLLRRERLHRVLDILGFLPPHYLECLTRYGKFVNGKEVKLAWAKGQDGRYEFIFQNSYDEMLKDFLKVQPKLLADGKKIPYDWTIYYLRKKGLSQLLTNQELAWVLLNFNQKRGYYQLRGEEEEDKQDEKVEYLALKVVKVEATDERKGDDVWYNVYLENGMVYRRTSKVFLDWEGKTKEFIVTTKLNSDGTPAINKEGEIRRSFRTPQPDDWTLQKKKAETDIDISQMTVGTYIYDALLHKPDQKIKGKLIRVIERKYYKDELRQLLAKQIELNPVLQDNTLYRKCIKELYPSNDAYRKSIDNKGFSYLFVDDIIFYQRPLKSKKSLIATCPYEELAGIDPTTGETRSYGVRCIAKSHPLYQEFRLWQFVHNLRIFNKETDKDVTYSFIKNEDDLVNLFDWLNDRATVSQKALLSFPGFNLKKNEQSLYRWNYVEEKDYPCNETRSAILAMLKKAGIDTSLLSKDIEEKLWHILYSVEDKGELERALTSFAARYNFGDSFAEVFKKAKPYDKDYGSYSAKAIKKLLPLMRTGKYWSAEAIAQETAIRINHLISGEVDDTVRTRVREKAISLTELSSFKGLPLWLACYVVYDRHSEVKDITKWETPADIDIYLKHFKQHSLRNPIVEQVITETLRVVRDIWTQEGCIDEIHIELGREMKNPADKRRQMTEQILKNEDSNLRIRTLLTEFLNPDMHIENVRPYSASQQELLKIYEDGVMSMYSKLPDDIIKIQQKFKETDTKKRPSQTDIIRYKAWLEQGYRSPYTNQAIPLSKLFTPEYEIEHIIPQSRYFDDSLSNKVICESAVNKLKGNMLGMEFIKNHPGEKVQVGTRTVSILTVEEYEQFVKDHFPLKSAKRHKLLMEDIPEDFIQRQLNDSRYISKVVKSLLSNIVREEGEEEAMSKNVIVCTGSITDRLKKDWGIGDVWNSIILPRFERLNEMTGSYDFTAVTANGHIIPEVPPVLKKGFSKKRIDHRHHAMDAIVIACASRNIVNYLNNSSASSKSPTSRYDLQRLLCTKTFDGQDGNYQWILNKPWDTFTQDVRDQLQNTIVSFKQNLRVINKTSNKYQHFDSNGKKMIEIQTKGDSWAIRKSMHKETVFGDVNLRFVKTVVLKEAIANPDVIVNRDFRIKVKELLEKGYDEKKIKNYLAEEADTWQDINIKRIEVYYFAHDTQNERYYATRKSIDTSFTAERIKGSVTDTGIQNIMLRHLEEKGGKPDIAFSSEGIDEMNENITRLNNGTPHKPIYKVRVYEKANKFAVGQKGNKSKKFVEAAKGTNLFFAIYETEAFDKESGEMKIKRSFDSIPLNIVIERLKSGLAPVPPNEDGVNPKYVLSPNDLVYLPTKEELRTGQVVGHKDRIYKFVSCTNREGFFVVSSVASIILDKYEFSPKNKMERAITGEMIKETCLPIRLDRLGNIIEIG